jgi:hypothetical protein
MGTRRRPHPGLPVLLAVLAAESGVLAGAPPQATPRLDDTVASLNHYVRDYEDKLTLIVADESYLQRVYNQASGLPLRTTRQHVVRANDGFIQRADKEFLAEC